MTPSCESHCSGLLTGSGFSSQGLNHQISLVVLGGVSLSSSLSMENLSIWYFCRVGLEEHCIALEGLLSSNSERIVAEVCVFIFFSNSLPLLLLNPGFCLQYSLTLKKREREVE